MESENSEDGLKSRVTESFGEEVNSREGGN
jgi:hypothetical protein